VHHVVREPTEPAQHFPAGAGRPGLGVDGSIIEGNNQDVHARTHAEPARMAGEASNGGES
jgi:hypothetical protein